MNSELLDAFRYWRQRLPPSRVPLTVAYMVAQGVDLETARRTVQRGAELALKRAREDVANGTKRYPSRGAMGWGNRRSDDGGVWVENLDAAGLRFVGYADEISELRHTGWFTADDGDNGESLRGCVLQLPAGPKGPRYLAAYEDPNNSGTYRVDLSRRAIFEGERDAGDYYASNRGRSDAARDAARAADSFAERVADNERDWNRAWQAGSRYSDLGEQLARELERRRIARREQRKARKPDLRRILKETRAEAESRARSIIRKREELKDSVYGKQREAFNEGASRQVFP